MLHTSNEKTLLIRGNSFKTIVPMPVSILRNSSITPGAKLLFANLLSYAWFNAECFPGQLRLAKDLGVSVDTIKRKLDELKAIGLVNWTVRGLGHTNTYYINDIPKDLQQTEAVSASVRIPESARMQSKVNEEEVNKYNDNEKNGSFGIPKEHHSPYKDEKISSIGSDVNYAINYYFLEYRKNFGKLHPFLKGKQLQRVKDTMSTFAVDWDIDYQHWKILINQWFGSNIQSDYNINHFATEKMLENRFFEVLY